MRLTKKTVFVIGIPFFGKQLHGGVNLFLVMGLTAQKVLIKFYSLSSPKNR